MAKVKPGQIDTDSNNAFVSSTEKSTWNAAGNPEWASVQNKPGELTDSRITTAIVAGGSVQNIGGVTASVYTSSITAVGYVQNVGGLTASMVTSAISALGYVQNVGNTTASSVLKLGSSEIETVPGTAVRADKFVYVDGTTTLEAYKPAGPGATAGATWSVNINSQPSTFPPTTPIAATAITEDTTHRFATDTEKGIWNGKQDALGFTAEDISHKGAINGYAPVDAAQKVPVINLGGAGGGVGNYLRGDQTWATPVAAAGDFDTLLVSTSTISANKVRTIGGAFIINDGGGVLIIEDTGKLVLI